MSLFLDFFLNKAIDSGFLKSRIQAGVRALAVMAATYLVQHGLANQQIGTALVGFVTGLVALYLQDLDVKVVDGKLKIALNTPVAFVDPTPSGQQTEAQEEAETKALNNAQHS